MTVDHNPTLDARRFVRHPNRMMTLGIVIALLGAVAIFLPGATTIGVEMALGALLVVAGAAQLFNAAFEDSRWDLASNLLLGILAAVMGLLFLLNPMEGILTLTLFIGALFIVSAVVKFVTAWRQRREPGAGWALASGIASLTAGLLIAIGWPEISAWVLGLLFGIDLVFFGASLIAISVLARRARSG